jgi:hypothetical protein
MKDRERKPASGRKTSDGLCRTHHKPFFLASLKGQQESLLAFLG